MNPETKICTKCNVEKPLDEFSDRQHGKYNKNSVCKVCISELAKVKYVKNKGRYRANNRKWELANKAKRKVISDRYKNNNPEKVKASQANWRKKNLDHVRLLMSLWRKKNPERAREISAKWAKNNPGKRNARSSRYKATKKQATPLWSEIPLILELYELAASMRAEGVKVHVDHAIPLVHPLVCGLHCYDNLQILSAEDNLKKHNKYTP